MENNTENANVFTKYPALKMVAGVAVVVALFLGVQELRDSGRLSGVFSDASCYGYNCQPFVVLGGRAVTGGYQPNPISYGTLTVRSGTPIELTWSGSDVDRCKADWTRYTGTYLAPTVVSGAVTRSQVFEVTCFKGRQKVKSNLRVRVLRPNAPLDSTKESDLQ